MRDPATGRLVTRLPTPHVARAALHVASIIGDRSSAVADARESYWHHATGGTYAPSDLRSGEKLLIDCGLVGIEDGQLVPSAHLEELLAGTVEDAVAVICRRLLLDGTPLTESPGDPRAAEEAVRFLVADEDHRRDLLLELGRRFDDARHRLIGEIGENLVVRQAREELLELGRVDLARRVQRVSLISDQLGYDVVAPTIGSAPRMLEVKSTSCMPQADFSFFISRSEAETGLRLRDWALVACVVTDEVRRRGEVLGWLPGHELAARLPRDSDLGRWTQAELTVSTQAFFPGLPRSVA